MAAGGGASGSARRSLWGPALLLASVCALPVLMLHRDAAALADPHDTAMPKFCLNCHTEEIYSKSCSENDGYCLLAGTVDGICMSCHVNEECCKPGLEHLPRLHLGLRSHLSDIDARDVAPTSYPRTLPIHQGRITCRTCHLHTREPGGDYKMLRLVRISSRGVDWTALCQDCHRDR